MKFHILDQSNVGTEDYDIVECQVNRVRHCSLKNNGVPILNTIHHVVFIDLAKLAIRVTRYRS